MCVRSMRGWVRALWQCCYGDPGPWPAQGQWVTALGRGLVGAQGLWLGPWSSLSIALFLLERSFSSSLPGVSLPACFKWLLRHSHLTQALPQLPPSAHTICSCLPSPCFINSFLVFCLSGKPHKGKSVSNTEEELGVFCSMTFFRPLCFPWYLLLFFIFF